MGGVKVGTLPENAGGSAKKLGYVWSMDNDATRLTHPTRQMVLLIKPVSEKSPTGIRAPGAVSNIESQEYASGRDGQTRGRWKGGLGYRLSFS